MKIRRLKFALGIVAYVALELAGYFVSVLDGAGHWLADNIRSGIRSVSAWINRHR